jgi:hypothetical protein
VNRFWLGVGPLVILGMFILWEAARELIKTAGKNPGPPTPSRGANQRR